MKRVMLLVLGLALVGAGPAVAACADGRRADPATKPEGCSAPPAFESKRRYEPYDPAGSRSGRAGFIDLGGGTEVRVGGRTRVEFQTTR